MFMQTIRALVFVALLGCAISAGAADALWVRAAHDQWRQMNDFLLNDEIVEEEVDPALPASRPAVPTANDAKPPAAAPQVPPGQKPVVEQPAPAQKPALAQPALAQPAPAPPVAAQPPAPGEADPRRVPGRVIAVAREPNAAKPVLISRLADDIAREARKAWLADKDWPQTEANYSTRNEIAIANRQLVNALMARQDNHPSVDAYVRWQMLSFAPNFADLKPSEFRRLIDTMPDLTRLPVPPPARNVLRGDDQGGGYFFSGVQRAFISDLRPVPGTRLMAPQLSVLNSGSGIATKNADEIIEENRSAAYDLVQSTDVIVKLNVPATLYREGLIGLLPVAEGVKLEAMFVDMKDRIEAGDPTYKDAAQAFFDEARRTKDDASIPEKVRANLIYQLRNLARHTTFVAKNVEIARNGDMKVEREVVAFPRQHVETLVAFLKGPQRPDETK